MGDREGSWAVRGGKRGDRARSGSGLANLLSGPTRGVRISVRQSVIGVVDRLAGNPGHGSDRDVDVARYESRVLTIPSPLYEAEASPTVLDPSEIPEEIDLVAILLRFAIDDRPRDARRPRDRSYGRPLGPP